MDWYIRLPILKDWALLGGVWVMATRFALLDFKFTDSANQLNIISSLIGVCISLGGFLIAALTILISYRLNTRAKDLSEAESSFDLLFVSQHYRNMINVIQGAIIELFLLCIFLYVGWVSEENFSSKTINTLVCIGIIGITLPIFRSMFLLFRLLSLDDSQHQRQAQYEANSFR